MADNFQRVEPTPFDTPRGADGASHGTQAGQPRWLWPALALLVLLVLVVIFVLPGLVATRPDAPAAPAVSGTGAGAPGRSTAPPEQAKAQAGAASPFADALEAKARAAAQELLGELLQLQEELVARGAETWAAEGMAAVAAEAERGDASYRERAFDAALASYESALAAARDLETAIPQRAADAREQSAAAIEALDIEAAREAFALAEQLEPGAEALLSLSDRLDALPDTAAAVAAAAEAEAGDDLAAAVQAIAEAETLDPAHRYVAAEAARLRNALADRRFGSAMSAGYAALEAERFDAARREFERAAGLREGSDEAAAALRELAVAETAAQLRRLKARGEALVAEESWAEAIPVFEEALAIDGSLRFAREGLALARPRAALTSELAAILDEPGRLVDDAILAEARQSLAQAEAVADPGPKLAARIAEVREVLTVASRPVTVTLRSDGETSVTVYKVARLGQFSEQQLSLRPGRYTAVGMRRGFRDVRSEFTVTPSGLAEPVFIACTEAI
jgi:hypothetical protein